MSEKPNASMTSCIPLVYQNFNSSDMERFYATKRFLKFIDATSLLTSCIHSVDYEKSFTGYYNRYEGEFYEHIPFVGAISRYHIYKPAYNTKRVVLISTEAFMEKLDLSLYYWRELNPHLVELLSSSKFVEIEKISNWVKMVHYMQPELEETSSQK